MRILTVGIAVIVALAQRGTSWRLPVTIEATRDVLAHAEDSDGQHRGILYISSGDPVSIKKGQRFQMIKIYSEGECRIRFGKKEYDVSSCPWLDGFTDHQTDIFRVVMARK